MRGSDRGELKRLAHDVRNALNGVAVNLEVARSRAARGAEPAQLVPFLEAAARQLDAASRLHKQYTDATIAYEPDDSASSSGIADQR